MLAATATRGAGTLGKKRLIASKSRMTPTPTTSVVSFVSGMLRSNASWFWRNLPFGKWTPRIFGIWSSTITQPNTGFEANQYWLGDETGYKAQAQDGSDHENRSN